MGTEPSSEELQRRDRQKDGITASLAVIVVLGAVAIYFFVTAQPDELPPRPVRLDPLNCERVVELEQRSGLIKARPSPSRIDVDEPRWARMTDDQRRLVLDNVACVAFEGHSLAQLDPALSVSAHSGSTGRLLTRAAGEGVHRP